MPRPNTNMPADIVEVHELLSNELYYLYTKWNVFKKLYCVSDETIDLLNYVDEFTFRIIGEVLRDDVILALCRIMDRATTRVNKQMKDNLTLKHLSTLIPPTDVKLSDSVSVAINAIKTKADSFKQHRNRRIGHHDLDTRKKSSTALLPKIDLTETDDLLRSIADLLNSIEKFYDHSEQKYTNGFFNSEDGEELIEFIREAKDLREYCEEKGIGN